MASAAKKVYLFLMPPPTKNWWSGDAYTDSVKNSCNELKENAKFIDIFEFTTKVLSLESHELEIG